MKLEKIGTFGEVLGTEERLVDLGGLLSHGVPQHSLECDIGLSEALMCYRLERIIGETG